MPIRVEQAVDDPIVTFIFVGGLDAETVRSANEQATLLLEQMGTYYAILDIRDVEITIGEALALLDPHNAPGLISDPRINPVIVGHPIPGDPTDKYQYPVFDNRQDATEYIRRSQSH